MTKQNLEKTHNLGRMLCASVFAALLALTMVLPIYANNIQVTSVTVVPSGSYAYVQFDLSWENSWKDGINWDAAWVFVKYKPTGGDWAHATLDTSGHSVTTYNGVAATITTPTDGKGAFLYRTNNAATSSIDWDGVSLKWNYGTDGLQSSDTVTAKVFAIEMVSVPTGTFAAGSGGSESSAFTLTTINTGNATTDPSGTGGFSGSAEGGYPTGQTAPENDSWPNGYTAFYCMKYEISQEQYVAFLNTLTRTQQNTRTATNLASEVTSVTNRYVMINSSSMGSRNGIRCDATVHASNPITFYCDYDGDGTGNESDDGQNIACNYLSWADGAAYANWAGLRPMTELEYEKACRGTIAPVENEYAWGTASIADSAYTLADSGTANEGIATNYSTTVGNCSYSTTDGSIDGPLRVGIFAAHSDNISNPSRWRAGATYYGLMEMSGNLYERAVTIGNADGRQFTGGHGDGSLDNSGDADISNWPGTDAAGAGFRGGGWISGPSVLRVSDRLIAAVTSTGRSYSFGFRCVRSAP